MADSQPNGVLACIRSVLAESNAESLTDKELLRRFATQHDEVAFKALLRRHGPMVLRVCQRVLERSEDAEDVFQATFLVLAKKAGSTSWSESVGTWLYEVGYRLALEARRKRHRQQAREAGVQPRVASDPLAEITGRELVTILDEELGNLPERYRAPLLLCCLEGKSGDEAARQLGCSPSTLQRRLRQARDLLQNQLRRRGFTLSAAVLSALLLHNTAPATVPAILAATTAQAACLLAAGQSWTAGPASAAAVALAQGVASRAPVVLPGKVGLSALLVGAGLLAGIGALAWNDAVTPAADGKTAGRPFPGRARDGVAPRAATRAWAVLPRPASPSNGPVAVTIETTLATGSGQVRQFAFDGDPNTYFASAQNASRVDHFTLRFDRPVTVQRVVVDTGLPGGGDALEAGTLEASADGNTFELLATFTDGVAKGKPKGRKVRALRIKPAQDLDHPLTVREVVVESSPALEIFKYPVEVAVDATDAPDMREWAEQAARVCERAYSMICEELKSDGFAPRQVVTLTLRNDYFGAVKVSAGRITASVPYFRSRPDDVGALVHMMANVVQNYRSRNNPTWLVEGVADYVRFFKYEPGRLDPFQPDRLRYDGGFRMTATFLAYLTERYDKEMVRKINQVMREGDYKEEIFEELTGKTLQELEEEWRESLRR